MKKENLPEESYIRKVDLHIGENILYRGEEAIVLDVKPVLMVKLLSKDQVICGHIQKDVRPCRS